jgi:hypothetical protein
MSPELRKKLLGTATFAFMIVSPLVLGYMVWTQFDLLVGRARITGHFALLSALRVILSTTIAFVFAWMFWGTMATVGFKRWKKKRRAASRDRNA